jgi:hypothetical protein
LLFVNADLHEREREREREREKEREREIERVNWVVYWQRVREGAAVSDQQVSHLPLCSRVLVADQGQHHARRPHATQPAHSRRKINKQEVHRDEVGQGARARAHTHTHTRAERDRKRERRERESQRERHTEREREVVKR